MGTQKIYLKEQIWNAVFDRHGIVIPFHEIGGDIGGIKLDSERDAEKIADIEDHIKSRTGGIWASTEAEYEGKKKVPLWRQSAPHSDLLQVFRPQRQPPEAGDTAVTVKADVVPPAPSGQRAAPIPIADSIAELLTKPTVGVPADSEPPPAISPKTRIGRASQSKVPSPLSEPAPIAAS